MTIQFLLIIAGLALLLFCGDLLVRGAVGLAKSLKIPALIISLTVVSFGTSAPELFVSVQAVLVGDGGIALGNIIGSNIANIFLVLGVPAMVYPIKTYVAGLGRHAFVMIAATAAFAAVGYMYGSIDPTIGMCLLLGVILYITYLWVRTVRSPGEEPILEDIDDYGPDDKSTLKTAALIACGLLGMPLGAYLLVSNGAAIAGSLGVREELIGLTIIAFGTSLPELATVVSAAVRKQSDVAIGGIIGSNIFNIFAVGGAAGIAGTAKFDPMSLRLDIPVMILAALFLAAYVFTRKKIGRLSGLAISIAYIVFIYLLATTGNVDPTLN